LVVDGFDALWQAYPRRTGKGAARLAYAKALKLTTLDTMLAALQWQVTQEQWLKDGGTYIPHLSTWLNQERWDDEPMEQPTGKATTVRNLAVVQKWAQR
jgi:hypothetical protein